MGGLFGGYFRRKPGGGSRGTLLGGSASRGKAVPQTTTVERPKLPPPVSEVDPLPPPPVAAKPAAQSPAAKAGFWGNFLDDPRAPTASTSNEPAAPDSQTPKERLGWLLDFMDDEEAAPAQEDSAPKQQVAASAAPSPENAPQPAYRIQEQAFTAAPKETSAPVPSDETIAPALSPEDTSASEPQVHEAPASTPDTRMVFGKGSPMQELMEDKVSKVLLRQGVITMAQGLVAVRMKQQKSALPIWRFFLDTAGVDRAQVLAEAARVLGYRHIAVEAQRPSEAFVHAVYQLFPADVVASMKELNLLPYELEMDTDGSQHTLIVATPDPAHPDILALMQRSGLPMECFYAPVEEVARKFEQVAEYANTLPNEPETDESGPVDAVYEDIEDSVVDADVSPDDEVVDAPEPVGQEDEGLEPVDEALDSGGLDEDEALPSNPEDHVLRLQLGPDGSFGGFFAAPPPKADGTPDTSLPPSSGDGLPSAEVVVSEAAQQVIAQAEAKAPTVHKTVESKTEPLPESPGVVEPVPEIKTKDRVVLRLLRAKKVNPRHVVQAQELQEQESTKEALWRTLTRVKGVERDAIFAEAARVYAFRTAQFGPDQPDPEFTKSVMDSFEEEQRNTLLDLFVMPLECDLEPQTGAIKLSFITHDPTRPEIQKLLQQLKLERYELCYAPESLVKALIAETFPRKNEYLERIGEDSMAFDFGTSYEESKSLIDEEALEAEISRSTLINLFEATLVEAVRQGASDVHIFPNAKKQVEIHFRIDGRLQKWMIEDKVHPEALLAVIKDNSMNVDRFEREAAQDGFIQRWIDDALIRFRVSVLPIANALQELRSESIVIRVLDDRKVITDLNKLGLLPSALERFSQAIRQPHGMVILTGPTGSGKSTTLVAALHQVVSPEVNVLTVEDPVEYIIPGVRQIKLNHKLTLDGALRAILRHDPDVVMVGEMRDRKTAEMGIKLANTGHLTFSTLHTNDAPSAITRLYKMGIEPFLIAYAINLVVAQRLVRVVCPTCKKVDDDPDEVLLRKLGFTPEQIANTTFYHSVHDRHCPTCKGVGYKGRRAICEALYFSRSIRHMIADAEGHLDEGRIRDQAVKEGMMTLKDSAREYVIRGETDVKEMIRVTTTDEG